MNNTSFAARLVAVSLLLCSAFTFAVRAGGDERVKIEEKKLQYKNWTFDDITTGKPVSLREFAKGKKLVLVVYFSPWCGNWRNEAPLVAKLYDKYKAHGFDVVAVNNYGTREQTQKFFGEAGAPYTVVVESTTPDARDKTSHYACRIQTGDKRTWGSPYNVFVEPDKIAQTGDVLMERAHIASGELIEDDAEKFIRARLGLKGESTATQTNKPMLDFAAISVQASQPIEAMPVVMPQGAAAWAIQIITSGGFGGTIERKVVTSAGELTCDDSTTTDTSLAPQTLRSLSKLVAEARSFERNQKISASVCKDCRRAAIMLSRREADGTIKTYSATWDETTRAEVAEAMLQLYENVGALDSCRRP